LPADVLHVAGVATWLGGLVLLFAGLMPRADERTLREAVPRYSQVALVSVGVIVVTGVFQAFRQVNRFGALLDTDYGRLLLIKICIFLGLMVIAAVSRDIVNRRWRIPERALVAAVPVGARSGGSAPSAPRDPSVSGGYGGDPGASEYPEGYVLDEPTAEKRLKRSLLLEVVVAVVILGVTALLVNAAPARELDTGPYVATLQTKQLSFDVTITPANRGANEMHLFLLGPNGLSTDPADVSAELSQKENDIAPIKVQLLRLGPGHYASSNFTVPFAGDWQLKVSAVVNQVDEVTATSTVTIHS
jgi:copper transport protein